MIFPINIHYIWVLGNNNLDLNFCFYIGMQKVIVVVFGLYFSNWVYAQKSTEITFHKREVSILLSSSTADSLIKTISLLANGTSQYKRAWTLGTISSIYLFLNDLPNARKYNKIAIEEIKKLSPDSICLCADDLNGLMFSQYRSLENGVNMELLLIYNDLAIEALPRTTIKSIDHSLIFYLINNAATAWKYDFPTAMVYFEKLRIVATPMLLRGILSPRPSDIESVKDPLRRYVRFMYNTHFSKFHHELCVNLNCLEKAWIVTQLLKSRTFKSQIFKQELSTLDNASYKKASHCISYLDSIYSTDAFFKNIILNNFQMNSQIQQKIDLVTAELSRLLPSYELLIADKKTSTDRISALLKKDETYISLMYTDNQRNVYAWKFEKGSEPQLFKLNITSIDMFFRVEYFRNKIIGYPSKVNIYDEYDQKYEYSLPQYYWTFHKIKLEPNSNENYLFNRVIYPLNLKKGNKVIFEVDQNLGALPIGLLKDSISRAYLLENNDFVYTPSASIFSYLRDHDSSIEYTNDYIGFSYNRDTSSFVSDIIKESSINFPNNSQLNFQSSESQLYSNSNIKTSRYLHLSCHNKTSNTIFRLVFKKDSVNDGLVTEDEIMNNLQNRTELTALTSCITAPYLDEYKFINLHKEDRGYYVSESCVCSIGETFSNITSAFFASGSQKMLVTQWKIPDHENSAKFMADFYANISNGHDASSSLKLSQLKFSKTCNIQYWGGYILVGD